MRIHALYHVPFETLAHIEAWALTRNHIVSATHLYAGESPPDLDEFDWLIVMGGPMGVYDTLEHPWLLAEEDLIRDAVAAGRRVLGVCLGAQILSRSLGGRVFKNRQKEIGWYPVQLTEEGKRHLLTRDLPSELTVFHWHGDAFDTPMDCDRLVVSEACANQMFARGTRVAGIQFHFESTAESVRAILANCGHELQDGSTIMKAEEIEAQAERRIAENQRWMESVLDAMQNGER